MKGANKEKGISLNTMEVTKALAKKQTNKQNHLGGGMNGAGTG